MNERASADPVGQHPDRHSASTLGDFGPLRLLIVDDDPMVQEVLATHYIKLGFTVGLAGSGRQALEFLENQPQLPDVILCDRRMPDGSGAALLESIRGGKPEWDRIVFVFVTALTDSRDRHAMVDLHPDGYLTKPINFTVADQTLAILLTQRRGSRPEAQ